MHDPIPPDTMRQVLIVDDDDYMRLTLSDYLTDSGFQVLLAEDGAKALAMFEELQPDMVLLDLHLPVVDGLTVLSRLVEQSSETPVVIISGAGVMQDAIMALRLGAWDYITKPIENMAVLEHTLETAWERAGFLIERKERNKRLEREVRERTNELRREIKEHIRTSQALMSSEAKYRAIMERASDAFIVLDDHLAVLDVNSKAGALTGYTVEELGELHWEDLAGPDSLSIAQIHECLAQGRDLLTETRLKARDNSFRMVEFSAARMDQGRCLIILRDITDRLLVEAETVRAAHLASIGELASSVAHEVNNPLNAVINYTQIILDNLGQDPEMAELAQRLLMESGRIEAIVRNLLSFSRHNQSPAAPLSLADLLKDTLTLFTGQLKKDGITLTFDASPNLPLCLVKPNDMRQVFVNLLSNAKNALNEKYPEPDGKGKLLHIALERLSPSHPVDPGSRTFVRIRFADNGSGIPDDIMDKITQPFFTTKAPREGTGLGLSICRDIISRHQGRLWFSSDPGAGTTAVVELPAWEGGEPLENTPQASTQTSH